MDNFVIKCFGDVSNIVSRENNPCVLSSTGTSCQHCHLFCTNKQVMACLLLTIYNFTLTYVKEKE